MGVTLRVGFVCLGNICRSPMAEAVARALVEQAGLSGRVTVESFGTAGYHVGEPADPQAAAALARRGWPDGGHRARQISVSDVTALDLVLCADRSNLAAVRRLGGDASKVGLLLGDRDVPDPWGRPDAVFDEVLSLIEEACRELVAGLAARTG